MSTATGMDRVGAAYEARRVGVPELVTVAALGVLAAVVLYWRWVGFQGGDDVSYADAAMDWVRNFPALGTDHWSLRYPLVLPSALVVALFGPSVFALAAPNLLAYAALLVFSYVLIRRWFGRAAATILVLVYILLPQFPVQATYANPDTLEMVFSLASFWCLMLARERAGGRAWLLASGVLAGLGYLTREIALLLVPLYGILFLFRPAMPRARYLLVALGFVLVAGAQMTYFAARAGDPLYRMRISATHDRVDRAQKVEEAAKAGRALDSEGVLAVSPALAPVAAILVSQKYGLLFFLAIPAYVVLRTGRSLAPRQRSVVDCAALGALVAFLFVALSMGVLYVVPRYFTMSAALAAVPLSVLLAQWIGAAGWRRVAAAAGLLGFAASALLLLYLENTRPALAQERITRFLLDSDAVVHADNETARRMRYLLVVHGLQGRVVLAPPVPGALVVAQEGAVKACLDAPGCVVRDRMLPFLPGPGWNEVARFEPPRRAIGGVLERLGAKPLIPADIWRKIAQPGQTAVVYRLDG